MTHRIAEIKGLDEAIKDKLVADGIVNIEDLLAQTDTRAEHDALAKKLGVDVRELTEWKNRADLMRIDGVGREFANLLEEGGVDSCKELQHRVPENLHARLTQINQEKNVSQRTPGLEQIRDWIAQAKTLAGG
jgi:predicted flap endonuclease-1-like 5' DNA nuclease